ncbi:uncharacterized protein LOC121294996 [Polyodon spathula]|uniref:uncharacterized protein LOC121294996 n=1 Tax=Polyodon spathula TaxID=7913 RepID=UPI001B7D950E|nr:uncharacterized protein LOC121294996 [Polyodon spathula]
MGLLVVLLCCSLVSGVLVSHLQGGIMTFTPKGRNPDGTIRVDFRYKESFRNGCHREFYWNCLQGNCGSIEHFEYGTIDSDPLGDSWCQAEGYMSRSISSDKPFDLQDTSCCWIYNSNSASSWLLLTHVDLGTRSDTGFPNRSPVTTIPPIIRVPGNCPSAYTLMAHDLDGDRVRCRYGVASYSECYSCYRPPNFHLDESTCTLSFNGAGFGTTHVFELVLEDFSRQYITLRYGDGTTSTRIPFNFRKKRQSNFYTTSWWGTTTTTSGPSTTIPWSWRQRAPPTTSPPSAWWWGQPTSSRATTTTAPTTSPQQNAWWYNPSTTTTAPSTSTATPAQTTTTTAAPTTAAPTTTPFSTSSNYYDPLSKIPLQFIVQETQHN